VPSLKDQRLGFRMLHNRVFDLCVDAIREVALVAAVRNAGQSHRARAAADGDQV